jgi:hypothetical protein
MSDRRARSRIARLAATRPVAPEAFESYLKGSFLLQKDPGSSSEEAIRLFEASIALDPTFAPAHLGLARAYESLETYFIGGRSPLETRSKSVAVTRWLRAPTSASFAARRSKPDTGARSG